MARLQHHAVIDHVEPHRQELVRISVAVCKYSILIETRGVLISLGLVYRNIGTWRSEPQPAQPAVGLHQVVDDLLEVILAQVEVLVVGYLDPGSILYEINFRLD